MGPTRPPFFFVPRHIQFFHLYEVGWGVSDFHLQFFHLYEVATVGDICDDVRRPHVWGWP